MSESLPEERRAEIAELADRLALERQRINAPAPDANPPWGELCAWASRGSDYMAVIRAFPPEEIYRELLAEVGRLQSVERERDAFRAAVDAYISRRVFQWFPGGSWYSINDLAGGDRIPYPTREAAEAACCKVTGLEVSLLAEDSGRPTP
jgi:hypothetical protein